MRMLVSDYDNTFHIKDIDMEENVRKSNLFMKDDLFVIATGRNYNSYMEAKEQFNINTNYTIINHGATILKGDKVIYNHPIENELKEEIINLLHLEHTMKINCYALTNEVSIEDKDITKIELEYDDKDIAYEIFDLIKNKYKDKLKAYIFPTYNSLEIISREVDKAYAVDYIDNIENPNQIYVIGDNHNDYLMIKNYNGSCTHVAIDEVKQISKKEYQNVSNFIDEIMEI